VLKRDESKMDALKGILASDERDVDIVFFRIAAVLKGEHIDCASIPAEARRKVKDDLQAVAIAVRQTVEESFDAKVRPIGESIGILGRKVDAIGRAVSRRGAAGSPRAEARRIRRKACVDLWEREQRNFQLRGSLNTRLTYKAVYELHRHELEGIGVATLGQFRSCMHAGHCKRSRDSIKALQSRACASPPEPQIPKDATCQLNGGNGIIQTMKNGGKTILALMSAMLCGIGLYATPDGVAAQVFDPPPRSKGMRYRRSTRRLRRIYS